MSAQTPINAAVLGKVQQLLTTNAAAQNYYRQHYADCNGQAIPEATWKYYYYAIGAATTTQYSAAICVPPPFLTATGAPCQSPTLKATPARPALQPARRKIKTKTKTARAKP